MLRAVVLDLRLHVTPLCGCCHTAKVTTLGQDSDHGTDQSCTCVQLLLLEPCRW
jgi:hypothetical protein